MQKISVDLVKTPLTAIENVAELAMPKIQMDQDVYDFGEINQNESVTIEFKFKNIGSAPLLISSAKGSCGCTVPDFPREPINSGEEGVITVTFNSEDRKGKQKKMVTLLTNSIPSTKVLTMIGTVLVSEK